jgi:hypothetical protein
MSLYAGHIQEIGTGIEGRPDNSLPGDQPGIDNSLPPLPPDFKPDNSLPAPPTRPSQPIFFPVSPENPIALPPGEIWPPLPPSSGISGKTLILIYVVGVGKRWFLYEAPEIYPPKPPTAQPK